MEAWLKEGINMRDCDLVYQGRCHAIAVTQSQIRLSHIVRVAFGLSCSNIHAMGLGQLGFYCRHPCKYRFTTLQSVPLFDIGMINCGPGTDLSIISNGVYRRWVKNVIDE